MSRGPACNYSSHRSCGKVVRQVGRGAEWSMWKRWRIAELRISVFSARNCNSWYRQVCRGKASKKRFIVPCLIRPVTAMWCFARSMLAAIKCCLICAWQAKKIRLWAGVRRAWQWTGQLWCGCNCAPFCALQRGANYRSCSRSSRHWKNSQKAEICCLPSVTVLNKPHRKSAYSRASM